MAPISAPVLIPAAVMVLVAMALPLQLSAAAAAAAMPPPPAPIGQPGCDTTCGNVSVPYPFGLGPSRCYWPGLNLTCDTSHHPPRLLLGDGSLRVAEISLANGTVRVMRIGSIINTTGDLFNSDGWNASFDFGRGFGENGYQLSDQNELVVSGCNVMATLFADIIREEATKIVSGCASICTRSDLYKGSFMLSRVSSCTGTSGCGRAPLTFGSVPSRVEARWLYSGNHNSEQTFRPVIVFVAEQGWVDIQAHVLEEVPLVLEEVPLLLDFRLKQGLTLARSMINCPQYIQSLVCKSENSYCAAAWDSNPDRNNGYICHCDSGYDGNPYLAGGCQDVDECKFLGEDRVCFGVCFNTIGSYDCQCPQGTYGNPGVEGGCVDYDFNKDAALPAALPGCNTTCGDVSVPYPFGFGHPGCYWPGLNLTCDTSHHPPRLLLPGNGYGNGTLQVVHISLRNSTVRVIHHQGSTEDDWRLGDDTNMPMGLKVVVVRLPRHIGEPYMLSTRNEFIVVSWWAVRASLYGEYRNGSNTTNGIISQAVCSSFGRALVVGDRAAGGPPPDPTETHHGYCSGHDGCCHAPIPAGTTPKRVELNVPSKNTSIYYGDWHENVAILAFISEAGLTDQWHKIFNMKGSINYMSSPIVLQWAVKQGLSAPAVDNLGKCPVNVVSRLCKSENSDCHQKNGGFTCHCSKGYDGNPYVANGCQDIDECRDPTLHKPCLGGYCDNLPGHYECRCPRGMHGNAYEPGGCVNNKVPTGLVIGLSVASGPVLLLLILGILFLLRKFKQHKIKVQRQKCFKQNRGQLLQKLVSQNADIAERMIIPLDELEKATNNFDKDRELGGGGHGTVYKGIMSDKHVVAIKKSKIIVQEEIDEFINEVAILSQINHKNVVKLYGCCLETKVPLLVYEFISNGTLYQHLHVQEPRSLSWGSRLRIATEIATSLAYLHSSVSIPIIHRDIKSLNILLDDKITSKISDFGASRYIPVEKTGLTTRVQGTRGYLDPMYLQTGRLNETSDVYSFGIILVELLTRKKPSSYLSSEGNGLVSHFSNLLSEGNLSQIIDPQVMEEGGIEVQEVATLAASCINSRVEERPTMRSVEHTLHGLQGPNCYNRDGIVAMEPRNDNNTTDNPSLSGHGQRSENPCSRRYSLEQEMIMSSSYPR